MLSPMKPISPGELDPGIERAVNLLRERGIATYESCQGGVGHSRPEPYVKFASSTSEAMYAMAIVLFDPRHGLRPLRLAQVWQLNDGFPDGPNWEITFYPPDGVWLWELPHGEPEQ